MRFTIFNTMTGASAALLLTLFLVTIPAEAPAQEVVKQTVLAHLKGVARHLFDDMS